MEISELAKQILINNDTKARFDAALHDKELPHTVWSVGAPVRNDQTIEERVREKNSWQRVNQLKQTNQAKGSRF